MKTVLKRVLIVMTVVAALILSYFAYVLLSYYRIGDIPLETEHRATGKETGQVSTGKVYDILTYNIGFGAYQQEYDCVLDTACVADGNGGWKEVSGRYLKAFSFEDALRNTTGAADTVTGIDPDFTLLQETDSDSDRCYHIDQTALFKTALNEHDSTYCINFHTPFLCYPINDMMGRATSGLLTFSRYSIQSAARHEFTVSDALLEKLFDLDRCFSENRIRVDNGKELVIINLHMSAYDKGGVIRGRQRDQLYGFMQSEYEKGNYVIAGGDFNHDLLTNNPEYPQYDSSHIPFSEKFAGKLPKNRAFFFDDNQDAHLPWAFRVVSCDNTGTCRAGALPWNPETSLEAVLDGFIVSENVEVIEITNILTSTEKMDGYAHSDHQPAYMEFMLK